MTPSAARPRTNTVFLLHLSVSRLDNLLERRWSRNATLVQGLAALDIIEELGFGLDRMVAVMAEAGLPVPVFTEIGDTFVVTLYGAAARLRESLTPTPTGRAGRQAPQGVPSARGAGTRLRRPDRQDWALERLRMHGPISPREYAMALDVSVDTALNDLRDQVARGLVRAEGTTKDRRYALRTEYASCNAPRC